MDLDLMPKIEQKEIMMKLQTNISMITVVVMENHF
jgi:hypothetical protein